MTKVQSEPKPLTCYISHADADSKLATEIAGALRSSNANCEVLTPSISHGTTWRQEVDEKVKGTDLFVVLVSPAALSSTAVRDEWASIQARAWKSEDVAILPILVGETNTPAFLKQWKVIDARHEKPSALSSAVSTAVTDRIQSFQSLHKPISKELHVSSPSLKAEQTKRFEGLIRWSSKGDRSSED
jgi:TIR domain